METTKRMIAPKVGDTYVVTIVDEKTALRFTDRLVLALMNPDKIVGGRIKAKHIKALEFANGTLVTNCGSVWLREPRQDDEEPRCSKA